MKCICGEPMVEREGEWMCPREKSPSHPIRVQLSSRTMTDVAASLGGDWAAMTDPVRTGWTR